MKRTRTAHERKDKKVIQFLQEVADPKHWKNHLDLPNYDGKRNYLREAMIGLRAIRILTKDTAKTNYVFELLGNFPVYDILEWNRRHLEILESPELADLLENPDMPVDPESVLAMLDYPEGSLGREWALCVRRYGLNNAFLDWMEIETPADLFVYRTAQLHDLFHFILAYAPYETIGEAEVEAFLFAQSGAYNHILFFLGHFIYLLRHESRKLPTFMRKMREAYELGRMAEKLVLVRWHDLMKKPLHEVKKELGIDSRPTWNVSIARDTGRTELAHIAINVRNRKESETFFAQTLGIEQVVEDAELDAAFLSDGTDHHTLVMQEYTPLDPVGFTRSAFKNLGRGVALLRSRLSDNKSAAGEATVFPPPSFILSSMKKGLNHMAFRCKDAAELADKHDILESYGIPMDWLVNHGDRIKSIYFRDPAGNFCEFFFEDEETQQLTTDLRAGRTKLEELRSAMGGEPVMNYDLNLEKEVLGTAKLATD